MIDENTNNEPNGTENSPQSVEAGEKQLGPRDESDRVRSAIQRALEKAKEGEKTELPKKDLTDRRDRDEESDSERNPGEKQNKPEPKREPQKEKPREREKEEPETGESKKLMPKRSFTPEEKEAFDKAPDVLKSAFKRREKELGDSANALNSKLATYEQAAEKLNPILKEAGKEVKTIKALLKTAGIEGHELGVDSYLKTLVQADRDSRENPARYIQRFAEANGVDLRELVAGDPRLAFDDDTHRSRHELAALQARIDELEALQYRGRQSQEQEVQRGIESVIMRVAEPYTRDMTATEQGVFEAVVMRLHPEVEQEMYEQYGNVTLETVLSETMSRAAKFVRTQAMQGAEAANRRVSRAGSLSVSPRSRGTAVDSGPPLSVRDALIKNAKKLGMIS